MGLSSPSYPQTTTYNLSPQQQGYQNAAAQWLTNQVGQYGPTYPGQLTAPITSDQATAIGQLGALGEGAGAGASQAGLDTLAQQATGGDPYATTGVNALNQIAGQGSPFPTTGVNALNQIAGQGNPFPTAGVQAVNQLAAQGNPYSSAGVQSLNQLATQGSPFSAAGPTALAGIASGAELYDPFTAGYLQSTANLAQNEFQQQLPSMEAPFIAAGAEGQSSPMAQYLTLQNANFSTGLANTLAQQGQQAYQQGLSNQLAAAQAESQLYGQGLSNQLSAAQASAGLYGQGAANQLSAAQAAAGLYGQGAANQISAAQAAANLYGQGLTNQLSAAGQSANLYQQGIQNQLQAASAASGQGLGAAQTGLQALTMPQQTAQTADQAAYQAYLQQLQYPWQAVTGGGSLIGQVGSVNQPPLYGSSGLGDITGGLSSLLGPFAMLKSLGIL